MTTPLMRLPDVARRTGLPKSTIYALIARGAFPRPIKLSERASAWRTDELDQWVEACTKATRAEQAAT